MEYSNVIILLIMLVFALLFIRGKRAMAMGKRKNEDSFNYLTDKAYEDLSECKREDIELAQFMGDEYQYYLIARDKKSDLLAVVTMYDTYKMKLSSKPKCKIVRNDVNDKFFDMVICKITSKDLKEPLELYLVTKRHRTKGYIGKMLLDNCERLKYTIDNA